ncbi:MAG: phage tail sheath C-terminal domain-containing protein [Rhodospirillales bacterium]
MISFERVPIDIRVPGSYIEIEPSGVLRGLPGIPVKNLIIGQKLSGGTFAADVPILVSRVEDVEAGAGRGSMLHRMFRTFRLNNRTQETWVLPLDDDGDGNAAAGDVTFGGTVSGAGTVEAYIAGVRVRTGVASSDTLAGIATKFAAAVNAKTDLPVTAAVNGEDDTVVDVTARHAGVNGNAIDIRVNYLPGEALPPGLTVTITAMSGGTANPAIADGLAAIGDTWFTDIAMPYSDAASLNALEDVLYDRFGPLTMQDGYAYGAMMDTYSNLATFGNGRNSQFSSIMGNYKSPTPIEEWAGGLAGVIAFYSKNDPARPLQNLSVRGVLPPHPNDLFTKFPERDNLLRDGISTFKSTLDGDVLLERIITTYQRNVNEIEDTTFLDLETLKTATYLRYSMNARIQLKFPRHKLADDGTRFGEGQAIVTPSVVRNELIALARDWEEAGLVEGIDQYVEDLIVERDQSDPNRVNALVVPNLVNQFRVFAGRITPIV